MTDATLPPRPELPARLPCGMTREQVEAWVASVDAIPDAADRITAAADAVEAADALAAYVREWRQHHGARFYVAGATVRACAKAGRVADSYISRQVRKMGLDVRRTRGEGKTQRQPAWDAGDRAGRNY